MAEPQINECKSIVKEFAFFKAQILGAIVWNLVSVSFLCVSGITCLAQTSSAKSSIIVRINPRLSNGDGKATVSMYEGGPQPLAAFFANMTVGNSLAVGVSGPARHVTNGDTPFGVYKFSGTAGGYDNSNLGSGYGTGKVYLNDYDLYGPVANANRKLIRLHGGGTGLPNPLAPDQRLLPTLGCVRLKNRDVNALIRFISSSAEPVYVFMGDDNYLRGLANNSGLSGYPWWPVLRRLLNLPVAPVVISARWPIDSNVGIERRRNAQTSIEEDIKIFSSDVGSRGMQAFQNLQSQLTNINTLKNSKPADDPIQPRIAFVLCYMGQDCIANVRILKLALNGFFRGFFMDEAGQLVSRLMEKKINESNSAESEDLLFSLMQSSSTSDGALSEGLALTFANTLKNHVVLFFRSFARYLSTVSNQAWQKVVELVYWARKIIKLKVVKQIVSNLKTFPTELKDSYEVFKETWKTIRSSHP